MNQFMRSKLVFIKLCKKVLYKTKHCFQKAFNLYKIGLKIIKLNLGNHTFTKDLKTLINPNTKSDHFAILCQQH